MSKIILPRYPVYIPSKGRADHFLTARILTDDGVPFKVVVEPPEYDAYAAIVGKENVLVLPFHDLGLGSIPARNWIWEHAKAGGKERHWCIDDNIGKFYRWYHGKRIPCAAGPALAVVEDFSDRYVNVAVAGLNYTCFAISKRPPFLLNNRVYSCMLILNNLHQRWRGRYNEDADLCLQVLADNWCTVLVNVFLIAKAMTMTMKGGNTDLLYAGDGRLRMARSLERVWPGTVSVYRRFQRPQHLVYDQWQRFDTPLRLKPGIDLSKLPKVDEYGIRL